MGQNLITWVRDGVQPDPLGFIDTGQQLLVLCNPSVSQTVFVQGQLLSIDDNTVIPFEESAVATLSGAIVRVNLPRGFILSIVVRTGVTNETAIASIYIVQGQGSFQYIKFLGRGHVPFAFPMQPTDDITIFTQNITPAAGSNINIQFARNGAIIKPRILSCLQINDATIANRYLTFFFQSGSAAIAWVPSLAVTTASQITQFSVVIGAVPTAYSLGGNYGQVLCMPDMVLREFAGTPITIGTNCDNFQAGDQFNTAILDYEEF